MISIFTTSVHGMGVDASYPFWMTSAPLGVAVLSIGETVDGSTVFSVLGARCAVSLSFPFVFSISLV